MIATIRFTGFLPQIAVLTLNSHQEQEAPHGKVKSTSKSFRKTHLLPEEFRILPNEKRLLECTEA